MSSSPSSSSNIWSLCLTSRQGRKIIKISSSSSTKDLYNEASKELGGTISSLKYGFPPTAIELSDTASISSLLRNQERLQVEFSTGPAAAAGNSSPSSSSRRKAKSTNDTTTTTTTTSRPKSKRAAAKAATEAMPSIIKAQDKLMKQQQTNSKSSSSKKRGRTPNNNSNNLNSNNTTNNNNNKKQKKPTAPKNFTAGPGRRLADGASIENIVASASAAGRRNRTRGLSSSSSNQKPSDMSEALMGALNDRGKMGRILRRGMKDAVSASYETTRSFSRLAAIQSKKYDMKQITTTNKLHIEYKGTVDKTKTIEEVDSIPRDVLKVLLDGIYSSNQEALRPENVARLSPRVLWSLAYQFPNLTNIEDMYKELFANDDSKDWTFLRRRAHQLSEKALYNLRQEQGDDDDEGNDDGDGERALEAVAAVEHAMEHLNGYERTERQARQANAALTRLQQQQHGGGDGDGSATTTNEWKIVTPSEPDKDELGECIEASPPSQPSTTTTSSNNSSSPTTMTTTLITNLMKECHIHNWRELANVTDPTSIVTKLNGGGGSGGTGGIIIDISHVNAWIERAQLNSSEEIITEICDNNIDAVTALLHYGNTGTPRDLASWRRIPEMLHEQLLDGYNNDDDNELSSIPNITVDQISIWCDRAYQVLTYQYPWLASYSTTQTFVAGM